jgi:hypothetical protein
MMCHPIRGAGARLFGPGASARLGPPAGGRRGGGAGQDGPRKFSFLCDIGWRRPTGGEILRDHVDLAQRRSSPV